MKYTNVTEANKDQIRIYFRGYYANWRYYKILMNDKILADKYKFLEDIMHKTEPRPEAVIAQQMRNGLLLDSIASCIQYIEDLFALLYASKDPNLFVKNMVTYKAGTIHNFISTGFSDKEILELFHVPPMNAPSEEEWLKIFAEGTSELKGMIAKLQRFYSSYHFFYVQYKHGLTVALRPFNEYTDNQIEMEKRGEMEDSIFAFDNMAIEKIYSNKYGKSYRGQLAVIIPMTDNIQPHLNTLQKQDNLLRYVLTPDGTSMEHVKECSDTARICITLLKDNFLSLIGDSDPYDIYLPAKSGQVHCFKFSDKPKESPKVF